MDALDLRTPPRIRSLLVPLDGSSLGEHALPVARELARRLGATLELVMVLEPAGEQLPRVPAAPPLPPFAGVDPGIDHEAAADAYLARVARELGDGAGIAIATTLLEGAPAAVLAAHLAGGAAELVVMATHRRGEMTRFLLGSVADELVRRATVPVLLLASGDGEGEGRGAGEAPDLSRVLVPLDGSPSGAATVAHAVSVAGERGARYRLARVLDPVRATVGPHLGVSVARTDIPREHEEAELFLQPLVEAMRARGLDVETRIVVAPEPVGAILDLAREFDAGLIAMETHGYPRSGRLLLGSVAGRVLARTDVPVLLHRRAVNP